jgi:hypothetical protein
MLINNKGAFMSNTLQNLQGCVQLEAQCHHCNQDAVGIMQANTLYIIPRIMSQAENVNFKCLNMNCGKSFTANITLTAKYKI